MAALITTDQLAHRLQLDPGALDPETAALTVAAASGMVRSIGRQTYSFVAQETVELLGGERVLTLPQRPVVVDTDNPLTVTEAEYFGAAGMLMVDGRDFERVGAELTRGAPWWWANTRLLGWPWYPTKGVWAPKVRVTYSHGYTTLPDEIVKICLDVASSLYTNPTGLRSHGIDDFNEVFASEVLGAVTVEGIRRQLTATGKRRSSHSIRTA